MYDEKHLHIRTFYLSAHSSSAHLHIRTLNKFAHQKLSRP
jgi:hypothetical protein